MDRCSANCVVFRPVCPVFLNEKELDDFYFGFSNKCLWPLFHYFIEIHKFDLIQWQSYIEVNQKFADEVFNYLSISENEYPVAFKMFEQPIIDREYFDKLCDNFRSPHLWSYKDNKWVLRKIIK